MELMKKTIGQYLKEQAAVIGDHTAMEMFGWSCSFAQLDEISDLMAGRLDDMGVTRGTHVGIWSVNSPNWVFTFLALVKIGAVPVLINTCYRDEELKGILQYSDVEYVFCGAGCKDIVYDDVIADIRQDTPKVKRFLHLDEKEAGTWMSPDSFGRREKSPEVLARIQELKSQVQPEDAACMIFTSGTTSLPKGILLSHEQLINNSRAMVEAMHWGVSDKMCITVPLFHCFGITAGVIACITGGMDMCLIPYFRTAHVWDAIDKYECTILNGVPSMFLALIRKPKYAGRQAPNLRSGIIAGSPCTPEDFLEICRRFPQMHLQPSYGQTETSPCIAIADWDDPNEVKAVSAGHVIEHVKARIVDFGTGKEVPAGKNGEIQVQGYNVMLGYYHLPEANAKVFTEDGWLRTGDTGYFDEKGELHITGRIKEMIIRAGENISPQEIELAIRRYEGVADVKVVGVPAQVLQEEIAACVIPKPGAQIDKERMLSYLKKHLADYKVPAYVFWFEKFPMNASGKIELKELRKEAAERAAKQRELDGGAKG